MATMYIVKKNIESAGEMGPLASSQVRELVQSGELTAGDFIRNVNSQNWVRIDSVPQLASELSKPKSSPKNKDVDLEHPQQVQLNPDQAKGAKSGLLQAGSSPILTHAETLKTSVAEDGVLPPSIGFFTHRKKTILGVAMVVVFCITWWLVAGEAMQAVEQAEQAKHAIQSETLRSYEMALQAALQAKDAEQAEQASQQAAQASNQAKQQAYQQAKQQVIQLATQQASQLAQQEEQKVIEAAQASNLAKRASDQAFKAMQPAYEQAAQREYGEAYRAWEQAEQKYKQVEQAYQQAKPTVEQALAAALRKEPTEQAYKQETQASNQAAGAYFRATQASKQAAQASKQSGQEYMLAQQAAKQADQLCITYGEHFRTQASWGIGAGLLADVLILVSALVWQKITFKP